MLNAEDIKKWLKTIGKNRQWLAEQTLSSKGTVNNWLSSGKPIPSAKLALIERLMNGEEEIKFELPENFEAIIREKAEAAKKSIDDLVIEILEMTVQEQKKKEQANGVYQEAVEKLHPALDNDDEPEEVNNVILREVGLPEIMVVGNVAAGEITWSDLDEPYPVFDKGITALYVEGTSMEPEIKNGQIVLVRPVPANDDLEKYVGEIIVYQGTNDVSGITLKRLIEDAGRFLLAPINPAFRKRIPITGQIKACMVGKIDLTK
jgi:SOS-response transcriptional repressor LexA